MKKALILILILGCAFLGYLKWGSGDFSNPKNISSLLPQEIENKVVGTQEQVLSKVLKKAQLNSPAYKVFTNPSTTASFYLKDAGLSAKEGKEFLKEAFDSLKECAADGCGQVPDEDTGFYDAANTVAMISVKRILEAALLEPENLEAKEWLTQDDLIDLLNAPNSDVRKLSLKNLMKLHPSESTMEKVLDHGNKLSGYEAGDFVEGLIPYANEQNTDSLVDGIVEMMDSDDKLTAIDVLQRAEKLKVNSSQIERMAKTPCSIKGMKNQEANFKAMNYSLKVMAQNSNIEFDLKNYCP